MLAVFNKTKRQFGLKVAVVETKVVLEIFQKNFNLEHMTRNIKSYDKIDNFTT